MPKVAVFVGSLRRESINRKLAKALAKLAAPKLALSPVELGDVPMFNQDLEDNVPASVLRIRKDVADAEAVLFVTPEYNRSIPPLLKNAIDWVSRPYGKNGFAGKPAAIAGTSGGQVGTASAQNHLRSIATVLTGPLMVQPEVYLVFKEGLIDGADEVTDAGTKTFLKGWTDAFATHIAKYAKAG